MTERITDYRISDTTFRVAYGDITKLTTDAVVSSDDNFLSMGGGVSEALLREAGDSIRTEARKLLPLNIGDVAVTSAGELPAKYIFHAVTIDRTNLIFASEDNIGALTLKCMQLADNLGLKGIAFPALGTGAGGFPFQLAGEVMTRTIADYLLGETSVELVVLTLFARRRVSEDDLNVFYERAVAIAALSTQSKRLSDLLLELTRVVNQMNNPELSGRLSDLQAELDRSRGLLSEGVESLLQLEYIQDQSALKDISRQVVAASSEAQDTILWSDNQQKAQVLRTKLQGLYTLLNVHTSVRNQYKIDEAKYGGQVVPPIIGFQIEAVNTEIEETNLKIQEVTSELVQLGGLA